MKNRISQLAKIENTEIVPPVIVEDGVSLEKCSIGPSARIGKGCRIKNSKIRESVLFDEVKIADSRIRDSIIDERCDIVKKELEKSVIGSYTKLR
jgi:glucose-1-phosphate thymidylyltransferase